MSAALRAAARELHDEMVQGLADELDAVERRGGSSFVVVSSGTRIGGSGGPRYRFPVTGGRTGGLRPGAEVGFDNGTDLMGGVVVFRASDHVVVALNDDVGPTTLPGRLIADSRWLLLAQKRRLQAIDGLVRSGSAGFNVRTAIRAVGISDLSARAPLRHAAAARPILNDEQRQLIDTAHDRLLTVLWGPAGTGKTFTLVELVSSFVATGLRVLYLAPTNLSVDGLLESGDLRFSQQSWWRDGAVVRVGPSDGVTLPGPLRDRYFLDRVVARRIGDRCDDRSRYRRECEHVVRHARVTAATIHQGYLSPLLTEGAWDVLVTDESSMVGGAAFFAAAGLAQRIVIAGDFRQLPPIALSNSVASRAWLRRDPFDLLGIPDDIARGDYPDYLVTLREQFRMAPDIASLAAAAYDHQLRTHPSVLDRTPGPFGRDAVLFVDTHAARPRVAVTRGCSRSNQVHADALCELLDTSLRQHVISRDQLREVLVLTPFVAQAHLLQTTLRQRLGRAAPIVRTIHRSQGREADVVILDLTDASNHSVSRFFTAND
ncbi:MAG: DEAD/DEAH box helicase [Longimicrobiales bacterium]